jgi:hypothetical protein
LRKRMPDEAMVKFSDGMHAIQFLGSVGTLARARASCSMSWSV